MTRRFDNDQKILQRVNQRNVPNVIQKMEKMENEGNGTQKGPKPSTLNSFVIDKSGEKISTGVRFDVNALSSISQK